MALYDVVKPCIVLGRHYTRPSTQPVEVPDGEAQELVDAGVLVPHTGEPEWQPDPAVKEPFTGDAEPPETADTEADLDESDEPAPRARRRT